MKFWSKSLPLKNQTINPFPLLSSSYNVSNIMRTPNFSNSKLILLNKKNYIMSKSSSIIKNTYNISPSYQNFGFKNIYKFKINRFSSSVSSPKNDAKLISWKKSYSTSPSNASKYNAISNPRNNLKWAVITTVSVFAIFLYYILSLPDDENDAENADGEYKIRSSRKIKIAANDWMFFFYSTLPFNAASRLWGKVNSITLPEWFRPYGYTFYSYLFGANMDEMLDPELKNYKNLSEFFYRLITPESRPIEEKAEIVCPSDGKVLQFGEINPLNGEIEQVKGMTYNVKQFLGTHSHPLMNKSVVEFGSVDGEVDSESNSIVNALPENKIEQVGDKSVESTLLPTDSHYKVLKDVYLNEKSKNLEDLKDQNKKLVFAVIYLAPGDYHHYHSPVDWVVKLRRHFPGELFSVAPYFQKNFPNLFVLNERVALLGEWKYGFFSMTPVGATNVGSIKLNFDKDLITNDKKSYQNVIKKSKHKDEKELHAPCFEATYSNNNALINGVPLLKGEEMGGFMLGSTVVLCFEVPKDFKFDLKIGEKVKMGQTLGHFSKDEGSN